MESAVIPIYSSFSFLCCQGNLSATFPPTLIITAGRDSLCQEAEDFRDKLIQAGVDVTHKRFESSLHGFTLSDKPDAQEGWQMMIDHLKRYFAV